MRFQGKTAIVTAAGAGIGRATAEIFVREGATVVAVEIDNARLEKMAADLADAAGTVEGRCIDALDEAQVRALVADTEASHGGVDILVNAVGGSTIVDNPSATVEDLTFEEWRKLIDFNLSATFLFTNAVVPVMKRAGSGKIVNLSSIAGR
ncbi:MAG: SDR family NAD(P)-dependent oxidoreductase, partial [Rhodospirillaceae bacterium]|nr:SDR family NAD(P)-dependent oxidoreductase [Rhodospirillaceae bacterium]